MTSLAANQLREDRSDELPGTLGTWLLLGLLLAAPALDGCVATFWRASLAAILCGMGCLGLFLMLARGSHLRLSPGTIPLLLFTGLVAGQTLPFAGSLTPDASTTLGIDATSSLSLVPGLTMSRARECLALLVVFVAASLLLSTATRIRRLAWTLLLLGSVMAIYYVSQPFLEIVPQQMVARDHVFGTYLNRNHLAALFVLALIIGAGLFVNRQQILNHQAHGFARRQAYVVVLLIVTCVGLLCTGSRGALVSLVVGMLTLGFMLARRRDAARRWGPLLGIVLFLAIVIATLPEELTDRFGHVGRHLSEAGSRPDLWMSALRLFELFPLLGCGLGSFGELSVLTQGASVAGHLEHAHSDLLEFLAETGVLGINLLLSAAMLLGLHLLRRTKATRGDRRTIHACAIAAAVLAFCLHSLVDFNFQIPALTLWIAALSGAASGAMARANHCQALGVRLPRWSLVPAMTVLGLGAVFASVEAWACRAGTTALQTRDTRQGIEQLLHVHRALPGHGVYLAAAGQRLLDAEEPRAQLDELQQFGDALLRHNPFEPRAYLLRGWARTYRQLDGGIADLQHAVRLTPPSQRLAMRIEIGLELAEQQLPAAKPWFTATFRNEAFKPLQVLADLHAAAPHSLDLSTLIPNQAKELLHTYAGMLLREGRLQQRERVLDTALARLPYQDRLTVRDSVSLLQRSVGQTTIGKRQTMQVHLHLAVPEGFAFDGQLMCLTSRSDRARLDHYFKPTRGDSLHQVVIPPSLPPGLYQVALQGYSGGSRFPLGSLTIAERTLQLRPGSSVPAAASLYQLDREQRPLSRAVSGLAVDRDLQLFKRVRFSQAGAELALATTGSTPLQVSLDQVQLTRLNPGDSRLQRFALPALATMGTLRIRSSARRPEVLQRLTLLQPGMR